MSFGVPLKKRRRIPENIKEEIRKRVIEDESPRPEVAKEFGVSNVTVWMLTKGTPRSKGNAGIRGYTLKILQCIDERGYFVPDRTNGQKMSSSYKTIKKYLPNYIRKVECRGCVIIYDEKRKVEACTAFMGLRYNRITSWYKYRTIMSLFGICEPPEKAREELGKMGFVGYPHPKRQKFKKLKKKGENHQNLNEVGNFLLSDVLY